jgi:dTDP-glucose 4,6-dehydratase
VTHRLVVLGSNSFSGSHMVKRLLAEGCDVLGLSRSPEVEGPFRTYGDRLSSGRWRFQQLDVRDTNDLESALAGFDPDYVVNFAAQSMVAQSWQHPEHWYQTNVVALAKMTSALERLPSLIRYVHVTTPEVYGSTDGWIEESNAFHPSTPYAISRAAGDMHVLAMHRERGLPVVLTRAANVYGPGQQLYRIVPRSLLYARTGRTLKLEGGGESTRSFIHMKDVADATLRIAQHGRNGATYHISTDEIVSIRDLVAAACEATGADFSALVELAPERPGKDATYMLNSTLLKEELDWQPTINLSEGLRDTLRWIDANLEALSQAPDAYVHKE